MTPANNINGVVKDICIDGGKIVADVDGGRTLDATGMIVFPGGVDIHTHVAGGALNFARGLLPRISERPSRSYMANTRAPASAGRTPTTFATGYLYAGMGYTTVVEAAVPVLSAKHTHEELRDTPIIDKACLVLMANNENRHGPASKKAISSKPSTSSPGLSGPPRSMASRRSTPAASRRGNGAKTPSSSTNPSMATTSSRRGQIVASLAKIVDELACPIHFICLQQPRRTGQRRDNARNHEGARRQSRPHGHLQFHAYGGDDWHTMRSEATQIADYFNKHKNLTCDAGAVLLWQRRHHHPDGPWQHLLYQLTGRKWGTSTSKTKPAAASCPILQGKQSRQCCAMGGRPGVAFADRRPWRVFSHRSSQWSVLLALSEIIHLLMNADVRKERVRKLPPRRYRASSWRSSIANTRSTRSRSSRRPVPPGLSAERQGPPRRRRGR